MDIQTLATLSDSELLSRVKHLAHAERQATARLVAHLAELENRKLYLQEGCRSLFTYCMQVLHLSEHAAYNRIEAARAASRFPAVLAALEQGDVHLTAIKLLSPLFTAGNHRDLLRAAKHKSKREIEELIAHRRPRPDVPAVVRKLPTAVQERPAVQPAPAPAPVSNPAASEGTGTSGPAVPASAEPAPAPPATPVTPSRTAAVTPLAPERYKVQFTATAATRARLHRAQDLLRHRIPDGDISQVIDEALELLVRELEKAKFAATARPRQSAPAARASSRHVPAGVKRAVWERDQGRCTFAGPEGMRCTERGQLEFDHIRPYADGGTACVSNVRLLCRQHNQYEARQFFGAWQSSGNEIVKSCTTRSGKS